DGACVFAGSLEDPSASGRQALEQLARVLVAAVLAPHRAEHAELDQVRLAAQALDDQLVLGGEQTKSAQALFDGSVRDHLSAGSRSAIATDSKSRRPSVLPSTASAARSGCGINPKTLPRAFTMPAMASCEPFGLAAGSRLPSASQ